MGSEVNAINLFAVSVRMASKWVCAACVHVYRHLPRVIEALTPGNSLDDRLKLKENRHEDTMQFVTNSTSVHCYIRAAFLFYLNLNPPSI